jgi:hypothetical protein
LSCHVEYRDPVRETDNDWEWQSSPGRYEKVETCAKEMRKEGNDSGKAVRMCKRSLNDYAGNRQITFARSEEDHYAATC